MALTVSSSNQALLDAQLQLWHTTFAHIKSMALKSALDLRIADAIDYHGGAATLPQILTRITLPSSKIPYLRRLLRVLTTTGVFSAHHPAADDGGGCDGGEQVYALTPVSRLLVGPSNNLNPLITLLLDTTFVSPLLGLGAWLQRDLPGPTSLFEMKHGQAIWDFADQNQAFGDMFNEGMVSDSSFIMNIVTEECGGIFEGVTSLVDVAGGLGGAAQAIAKAFPHVTCSVLDLPHVVANAPASTDVKYIAGDMFESIPPANSLFLKWIMHDWSDEDCVKILKNCKRAIPPRHAGGKVILLDMVVGAGSSNQMHKETQVLLDLLVMFLYNGVERDEQEWKRIIFEAGFSDYKITPILGLRSIIEVYP